MAKRALITGITGQDGSYLAESLLDKGYEVNGILTEFSPDRTARIRHILDKIFLYEGDFSNQEFLIRAVQRARPHEVYNLAGQSSVADSWGRPAYTGNVTGIGVARMLEAVRAVSLEEGVKFFQASSGDMFGDAEKWPQNEETPFNPKNPYAAAKLYGHLMVKLYREHYGIFAVSGIFFNHESPRRGEEFVTRKITRAAARIKKGLQKERLRLGNPSAERDWGFAGDYVKAMWLMLQQKELEDLVIATGKTHTVREFVETAFSCVDLDWREWVVFNDPRFVRPAEPGLLVGDSSKARKILGWEPRIKFEDLVKMMVEADLAKL